MDGMDELCGMFVPQRRLAAQLPTWPKGRVERQFGTAQDRLVKGMRLAGVNTLEQANRYLNEEFLPWWNQNLAVVPASAADAHRALAPEHDLASALSHVERRQVSSDYTIRCDGRMYRITSKCIQPGLRGGSVRIEMRLDGSMAASFKGQDLELAECDIPQKPGTPLRTKSAAAPKPKITAAERTKAWRESGRNLFQSGRSVQAAAAINRTRTRDSFD